MSEELQRTMDEAREYVRLSKRIEAATRELKEKESRLAELREVVKLSDFIEAATRELEEKESQLAVLREAIYDKVEDHLRDVSERVGTIFPDLIDDDETNGIVREKHKRCASEIRRSIRNSGYGMVTGSYLDLTDERVQQSMYSVIIHYTDMLANSLIKNPYKLGLGKSIEQLSKAVATVEQYFPNGLKVRISQNYIAAKKEEIKLAYEIEEYKARQAEERRAILQAQREELAAQREIEREIQRARKDEQEAQAKLERRRMELAQAHSAAEIARLKDYIERLQLAVKEAQQRHERALSMAQQTRAGYVYVISNIGSFGEGVYKIGMTRRIEPMERVVELGDASVPFPFDVHAMIWSEDAPTLEAELHRTFDDRKVNAINGRKEFFRVTLDEVRTVLSRMGVDAAIVDYPTAAQYRDSLMIADSL